MMAGFELSAGINANNVFLVNHSELEGRLDIDYYRPKINALEKRIRQKTTKKLKNFIVKIASGATPSVQEETKFYSTKENGIPFLRVQNLNVSGELSLEDVKFINVETHNNDLKRSQVSKHDLLVKITGVGRMAIASVAPNDFDGNTNQHMVVIKTAGEEASRYLANYLNLDIIEALATRRSTGATRPALDYQALKSIPVIENIDFSLLKQAEAQKQQKEQQAQALLDSIDDYLLNALGITLPEQDNRLEKRIFTVPFSEIIGGRLDPDYNLKYDLLFSQKGIYRFVKLKELLLETPQYGANEEGKERKSDLDVRYIRITDTDELGNLKNNDWKTAQTIEKQYLLKQNDILFARSGSVGRCYIHKEIERPAIFAGYLIRFKINEEKLNPDFLFYYCNSMFYKLWVSAIERPAVQSNINAEEYKALPIPLPPLTKQTEIATHISQIRAQAKQLQLEASEVLATAKAEIERMILGEV